MKNSRFWEVLLKVIVAAATAAITALTTTSCMGHGPFYYIIRLSQELLWQAIINELYFNEITCRFKR